MSNIGELVERLVAAGVSVGEASEVVALAVAAGAAAAPYRKSPGAVRQQRLRDKRRGVTKRDESVTTLRDDESLRSVTKRDEGVTRNASYIEQDKLDSKKDSKPPTSRGSRIASDWLPSDEDRAFARQEGFSDPEIDREAGKFRDYWLSKSGRDAAKVTWSGTWRVWIRNNVDRMGRKPAQAATVDKISLDDAMKLFAKTGRWSKYAPCAEPGQSGCTVPPEMFEKYGLLPDGRKAA
jgi:hypothetical protein